MGGYRQRERKKRKQKKSKQPSSHLRKDYSSLEKGKGRRGKEEENHTQQEHWSFLNMIKEVIRWLKGIQVYFQSISK